MFQTCFSNFQISWQISAMEVMKKIQNFSSPSLQLCLIGKKTETWGVNTTIV